MISGHDTIVKKERNLDEIPLRVATQALAEVWPEFVVDNDGDEFLVYKNWKSQKSWQKDGMTDDNNKDMIQVITGQSIITVLSSDDKNATAAVVVKALEAVFS